MSRYPILLLVLLCTSISALAGGAGENCDGDLSSWPTQVTYAPPATAGSSASLLLGPPTVSSVAIYGDPAEIAVNGSVITVGAYWNNNCEVGLSLPPHLSRIPIPELVPGTYTIEFDILGLSNGQFSRPLLIPEGNASYVPVPAFAPWALAAIVIGIAMSVLGRARSSN